MSDAINPSHYKQGPVETIDVIEAVIKDAPSNKVAGLHWQVLKYALRCWHKNGVEDLKKAKWYLDRMIGELEAVGIEPPAAPQYRDVKLVDVGRLVQVRDSKNKPWVKRRLTGFVSKDHPGFAEDFRFVCGISNWKYARIKIGGEA